MPTNKAPRWTILTLACLAVAALATIAPLHAGDAPAPMIELLAQRGEHVTLSFDSSRAGALALHGVVTDGDGHPLPGAAVRVARLEAARPGIDPAQVTLEEVGHPETITIVEALDSRATADGAFSAHARAAGTFSLQVDWDELPGVDQVRWTIQRVERTERPGFDAPGDA